MKKVSSFTSPVKKYHKLMLSVGRNCTMGVEQYSSNELINYSDYQIHQLIIFGIFFFDKQGNPNLLTIKLFF